MFSSVFGLRIWEFPSDFALLQPPLLDIPCAFGPYWVMFRRVRGWSFLSLSSLLLSPVWPCGGAVLSIGHRGNSLYAPENTLASAAAARGLADMVETDVRVSADGKLVIMHDATVDRTTDGTGTVASKTVAQLKLLDAGSWFSSAFTGERIPTLEELLTNTLPYATVLVEQKAGAAAAYVDELRRLGLVTNVIPEFDLVFIHYSLAACARIVDSP